MKNFPLKKRYLGLLAYSSFLIRKHNRERRAGRVAKAAAPGYKLTR